MSVTLGELAVRFGCALHGDPQRSVDHVAPLGAAGPSALCFLANPRLARELGATRAGAVVLEPKSLEGCPTNALVTDNAHAVFARIASLLYPAPPVVPGLHPSAVVDPGAEIDSSARVDAFCVIGPGVRVAARCHLGPGCVLEDGVSVGEDTRLAAHVTLLSGVRVGRRVLVHPGAVLGADGFGFAPERGRWLKVPQVGTVVVGDDVEIGANTTIDRGAIEDTVIAEGVKLDNQIQIGHNVRIGAHTAIAGCTGVSGSTRIGERCMIGGAVSIAGHIGICDDVVIAGATAVTGSIVEPGVYSGVIPAEPIRRWRRIVGRLKLSERRGSQRGAASGDEERRG